MICGSTSATTPIESLPTWAEIAVAVGQDRHRVQCLLQRRSPPDRVIERFEMRERTAARQQGEDRCVRPRWRLPCRAPRPGDVLTEVATALCGYGLEQLGESLAGGVLIETSPHRRGSGLDEFLGRLRARSALPEVDGSDLGGELRHLPVDGLTDRSVRIGQTGRFGHLMPQRGPHDVRHHDTSAGATRPRQSRAASWRRELLAKALPPKGPGVPAVFVKVPPASSTMGTSAPIS